MHLIKKISAILVVLACFCALSATAYAAEGTPPAEDEDTETASLLDQAKAAGSELWGTVKEKAPGWLETARDATSSAVDTVREKAPEVWEDTKTAASDAAEKVQEKAPEVIDEIKEDAKNAQAAVSDWNTAQQDQFWQWFDRQTGMNTTGKVNPDPESATNATESGSDEGTTSTTEAATATAPGGNAANDAEPKDQTAQTPAEPAEPQAPADTPVVATKEATNPSPKSDVAASDTPISPADTDVPLEENPYTYTSVDTTANDIAFVLAMGGAAILLLIIAVAIMLRLRQRSRRP